MLACPHCHVFLAEDETHCPRDGAAGLQARASEPPAVLLKRFKSLRPFALGATGGLWLAKDSTEADQPGLLKVLTQGEQYRRADKQRIAREWAKQATVNNAHLAKLYASGESGGKLWSFREHVEGVSLVSLLQVRKTVREPEALTIAAQLAEGLDSLHRAGLLHRDVKPGHVVLGPDAEGALRVKLIDPGCPTPLPHFGNRLWGTAAYLAPEQSEGKLVSFRSDLYSLACLTFEMITGSPPYVHEDPAEVARMHREQPIPSLPEALEASVAKLLGSMMAKEAQRRPFSAQKVRKTLDAYMPGKGAKAAVISVELQTEAPSHATSDAHSVAHSDEPDDPGERSSQLPAEPPTPTSDRAPQPDENRTEALELAQLFDVRERSRAQGTLPIDLEDAVAMPLATSEASLRPSKPGPSSARKAKSVPPPPTYDDNALVSPASPSDQSSRPPPFAPGPGPRAVAVINAARDAQAKALEQARAYAEAQARAQAEANAAAQTRPQRTSRPLTGDPHRSRGLWLTVLLAAVIMAALAWKWRDRGEPPPDDPERVEPTPAAQAEPSAPKPKAEKQATEAPAAEPDENEADEAEELEPATDALPDAGLKTAEEDPAEEDPAEEDEEESSANLAEAEPNTEPTNEPSEDDRAANQADESQAADTPKGKAVWEQARDEARAHYSGRRYEQAAAAYRRATRHKRDDPGLYAGLGASYLAAGRPLRAAQAYGRAIELSPGIAAFHAALGRSYEAAHRRRKARQAYERALEVDPKNKAAREGLGRI